MAKPHERVFALIGALLFLGTTVGVTAVVIFQIREEQKQSDLQEALRNASKQTTQAQNQNQLQKAQKKEGEMLEGTKLADFTPVESVPELTFTDTVVGSGDEVKEGDTVTAHYTGALAKDGTIFQSSKDSGQPIPFSLNQVIEGWRRGVPGMKVGGVRRIFIPAALAYGEKGSGNIPPNSDLVFDVELVKIGQ